MAVGLANPLATELSVNPLGSVAPRAGAATQAINRTSRQTSGQIRVQRLVSINSLLSEATGGRPDE